MKKKIHFGNGKTIVKTYEQTTENECSICKAIKHYLTNYPSDKAHNLATGNYKRHIRSGKHWKVTSERIDQ